MNGNDRTDDNEKMIGASDHRWNYGMSPTLYPWCERRLAPEIASRMISSIESGRSNILYYFATITNQRKSYDLMRERIQNLNKNYRLKMVTKSKIN